MAIGIVGAIFIAAIFFILGFLLSLGDGLSGIGGPIEIPLFFWLTSIFLWCAVAGPFGYLPFKKRNPDLSSLNTFRVAVIGGAVVSLVTMFIIVPAFIGLIFVIIYIKRCLEAKPYVRKQVLGYKWLTSEYSWCLFWRRQVRNDEPV